MADPQSTEVRKSPFALLLGVVVRPRATFAHLRDHQPRSWWLPALLIIVCTVTPVLVGNAVASRGTGEGQVAPMMPGGAAMEGNAMVVEGGAVEPPTQATAQNILKLVGALIGTPVAWLLWGMALYLTSVFLGRSSSFKPMARLAVWAWLPYAIRGIAQAVYIWSSGKAIANAGFSGYIIDNTTPQLIPPGPGSLALASVLGRVDLFLVWNLALLVVGLQTFTGLPRRKATLAVLLVWVVLALLGVIPAIVGGLFSVGV